MPETQFLVTDRSAKIGTRVHELIDPEGIVVQFSFAPNIGTPVPEWAAQKFIENPDGFIVKTDKGMTISKNHFQTDATGEVIQLAANQVVASLDELSNPALLLRALQAGGKFKKGAKPAELIAFLLEKSAEGTPDAPAAVDNEDNLIDDGDDE